MVARAWAGPSARTGLVLPPTTVPAIRFPATGNRLRPSILLASATNFSACGWLRIDVDRNYYQGFFAVERPPGHTTQYTELITDIDGTTLTVFDHVTGNVLTLGALTVGAWYWAGMSVSAGGALTAYLKPEGGSITKFTGTCAPLSSPPEQITIGSTNYDSTEWLNGRMACWRMWNRVLTDAQFSRESRSVRPFDLTDIAGAWDLADLTDLTTDVSGQGNTLTLSGFESHSVVDGPTIG